MSTQSATEWTEATWNPVTGCSPISPGCAHCYARRMAKRLAGRCGYPAAPHEFEVTLHPERLKEPGVEVLIFECVEAPNSCFSA